MDFKCLTTFIQVAELNSFTKAGEKLGYSQPTISFQIKQLEKDLGVQLFERIGHTITLTEAGRGVLSYAQQICRTSEEMLQLANRDYEPKGTIHLAMADSLCAPLIINKFAEFTALYPKVSLNIKTAGTDELFRLLDHNEADIVCTLDKHIYNTSYIISTEEKVGVNFVCSAKNPLSQLKKVTIDDLLSQPFILTEKGMSYRKLLDEKLSQKSIEIHPILEIGSADHISKLVEENAGISFLPDYVTERAAKEKKIVRLSVDNFNIELWKQLLYHRNKWLSLQMKTVIDFLSKIKLNKTDCC